jgi:hypothetical protein
MGGIALALGNRSKSDDRDRPAVCGSVLARSDNFLARSDNDGAREVV